MQCIVIQSDLEFHTCDIHVKVDRRAIDNFRRHLTSSRVESPVTDVFGIVLRYTYRRPGLSFPYLLNCLLSSIEFMLHIGSYSDNTIHVHTCELQDNKSCFLYRSNDVIQSFQKSMVCNVTGSLCGANTATIYMTE